MSRGFDEYEIDDSCSFGPGSGRSAGRGGCPPVETKMRLQGLHQRETQADWIDHQQLECGDRERPVLAREERVGEILSQRVRGAYTDRDKTYSLRDSEIHTLSEVGKFRVVAAEDLAEFAYNGDRARMVRDVENLVAQGLVKQTKLGITHKRTSVVFLTKEGHRLLSRGKVVDCRQAIYQGLRKPKETSHDADLYRLFHKVKDEIEAQGGRVDRVILDYEMKEELYAKLAKALRDQTGELERDAIREKVAEQYHLKMVEGKIPLPDLRIEYADQEMLAHHRDLELATHHYRPQGLTEKAKAGFQIYARSGETDRLRRIRDDLQLTAAIFRL